MDADSELLELAEPLPVAESSEAPLKKSKRIPRMSERAAAAMGIELESRVSVLIASSYTHHHQPEAKPSAPAKKRGRPKKSTNAASNVDEDVDIMDGDTSALPAAPSPEPVHKISRRRPGSGSGSDYGEPEDYEEMPVDVEDNGSDASFIEEDDGPWSRNKAGSKTKGKARANGLIVTKGKGKKPDPGAFSAKNASLGAVNASKRTRSDDEMPSGSNSGAANTPGADGPSTSPTDAPPAKKTKLPPIPKKSAAALAASGPSTPTTKAGPRSSLPVPKPKPATSSSEVNLNDVDEYKKLFGIGAPGSGSNTPRYKPSTSSATSNYRNAEMKMKEIAAKREQARLERQKLWNPANCFDLQAGGDKIRAYEKKLWDEGRYLYISQIAAGYNVFSRLEPGVAAHRLPPPTIIATTTTETGSETPAAMEVDGTTVTAASSPLTSQHSHEMAF